MDMRISRYNNYVYEMTDSFDVCVDRGLSEVKRQVLLRGQLQLAGME